MNTDKCSVFLHYDMFDKRQCQENIVPFIVNRGNI